MSSDFHESEIKADTLPMCDLFNLSNSDMFALKERIEKWNGVVRVFVHPYFIEASYPRESHKDFPGHEKTGIALEMLVGKGGDRTPPIIIFEEIGRIKRQRRGCVRSVNNLFILLLPRPLELS